jgi:hypothetical protein
MAEGLPTPEDSRPNRVASALADTDQTRVRKVANASRKWERVVRRKHQAARTELKPRPDGSAVEFMIWLGHAVELAHKRIQQRRSLPTNPANQVDNAKRGGMPDVTKWRQLSKAVQRRYRRQGGL